MSVVECCGCVDGTCPGDCQYCFDCRCKCTGVLSIGGIYYDRFYYGTDHTVTISTTGGQTPNCTFTWDGDATVIETEDQLRFNATFDKNTGEELTIKAKSSCQDGFVESEPFDVVEITAFFAKPDNFPKCVGDSISEDDFVIATYPAKYADDVVVDANTYTAGTFKAKATLWSYPIPPLKAEYTIVGVNEIQYDDPDTGYTTITGTLYVTKGKTVTFKAIPNPSGVSWPSGKPVWGGSSGASGTGTTKEVTFNTLSTSTSDYKTVTAECGNTKTVNVIVFKWENVTTPQDNFTGGSSTKYGVYERVDLTCDISPTGLTGTQVGGLRWAIDSGAGTLSNVTNNGTALFRAHRSADNVTLSCEVQSGPSKGVYIISPRTVVEPDGGECVKRTGTNIWHVENTFSIGVNTYMYLRPTDVSFKWVKFTEGQCNSQTTGWFNTKFSGTWHNAWDWWADIGSGDSTNGCRILQSSGDFASLYDYNPPAYSNGTFLWSIPWSYKAGIYVKGFVNMNQEFKVDSNGKAEVQKDSSGWFYNYHSWPSQSY